MLVKINDQKLREVREMLVGLEDRLVDSDEYTLNMSSLNTLYHFVKYLKDNNTVHEYSSHSFAQAVFDWTEREGLDYRIDAYTLALLNICSRHEPYFASNIILWLDNEKFSEVGDSLADYRESSVQEVSKVEAYVRVWWADAVERKLSKLIADRCREEEEKYHERV